jgi:hypothetical protein
MDELETMAWLNDLTDRGKPARTIADWQPYEAVTPLSDTDLNEVIEAAARLHERNK